MFFQQSLSQQRTQHTAHKSGNNDGRSRPRLHDIAQAIDVLRSKTLTGGEIGFLVNIERQEISKQQNTECAVTEDGFFRAYVFTAFGYQIRKETEYDAEHDWPEAHSGHAQIDADDGTHDGDHAKFFDLGVEQHHGNAENDWHDNCQHGHHNGNVSQHSNAGHKQAVDCSINTDVD